MTPITKLRMKIAYLEFVRNISAFVFLGTVDGALMYKLHLGDIGHWTEILLYVAVTVTTLALMLAMYFTIDIFSDQMVSEIKKENPSKHQRFAWMVIGAALMLSIFIAYTIVVANAVMKMVGI